MAALRLLAVLVALAAVLAALLWLLQRRLIYLPDPRPVGQVLPGTEELRFTTADGLTLSATFVPGRGDGGTAVLVLPGNAGNRADRAPLAAALADAGLAVLLVDYRGYGGNPGRPSEQGLLADARAARAALAARPGIERIVLYGGSIGSAVALALAAEQPPAALILRSPFPSLQHVARIHYPGAHLLLRDRFPASVHLASVSAPLLVVAGGADRIVPERLSRELFAVASEPKRFVRIAGAGHNDPALFAGREVVVAIVDFLSVHGLATGRTDSP